PAKPEYARQYPVTVRVATSELGIVDLAGPAAPDEHPAQGRPCADLGAYHVPSARGATAALLLPGPVDRRGYRVLDEYCMSRTKLHALGGQIDRKPQLVWRSRAHRHPASPQWRKGFLARLAL